MKKTQKAGGKLADQHISKFKEEKGLKKEEVDTHFSKIKINEI